MTITEYHIELYQRVGGDVDHLQRIGTAVEQCLENQSIIVLMEGIAADLEVIKNGNTSIEYREKINSKLKKLCMNDSVIVQMKKLKPFR